MPTVSQSKMQQEFVKDFYTNDDSSLYSSLLCIVILAYMTATSLFTVIEHSRVLKKPHFQLGLFITHNMLTPEMPRLIRPN